MSGKALNLAIVLVALFLIAGLAMKLRSGSAANSAPAPAPVSAAVEPDGAANAPAPGGEAQAVEAAPKKTVTTESGATIVLEGSLAASEDATAEDAAPAAPLNTRPPSELALTDVKNYTTENGVTVLILRDGSKLMVNDFVYEQLPESIRFRLEYQREEGR